MTVFKSILELCDVVSHVIYCSEDASILLTLENNSNEYWIPSSKVGNNMSWCAQSLQDMQDIFGGGLESGKCLRVYKIWVPQNTTPYIYHCIFEVRITAERKKKAKNTYGKYRGKVRIIFN